MKQLTLNLIFFTIYAIPSYALVYFFLLPILFPMLTAQNENMILIAMILAIALGIWLSILPALICRTNSKMIIFILCFFVSPTLLGWILLMIWAVNSNNTADRHEDMMDLMSDRG